MQPRKKKKKLEFPQEWGKHLSDDVEFEPVKTIYPNSQIALGFRSMPSEQFEQFCFWLLKKEVEFKGCCRVGGRGIKQDGIDLFGYVKSSPNELVVFECKCWEELSPAELDDAVERFLVGEWSDSANQFILIIAQPTLGRASKAWNKARQKLAERGVIGECWTGEELTIMVQPYPDIVSKFFLGALTQNFCNEWMRPDSPDELYNGVRPDENVQIGNLEYIHGDQNVAQPEDGEEFHVLTDSSWSYRGPLLDIYCILPSGTNYPGSATITIKRPQSCGVTTVLSQKWLLENMFGSDGAPANATCRPFYIGKFDQQSDLHLIDLGNCRLSIRDEDLPKLIGIVDEFSGVYLNALCNLNVRWRAERFDFVRWGGTHVILGIVSKPLWNVLLEFACAHDYEAGDTEWHIFDTSQRRLLPCIRNKKSGHVDGFHGIFDAQQIWSIDQDNLVLTWSPPSAVTRARIGNENWWPCEFAYLWFEKALLPEVRKWWIRQSIQQSRWWPRTFYSAQIASEYQSIWDHSGRMRDSRIIKLVDENRFEQIGLVQTLTLLQGFYNGGCRCSRAYFSSEQMVELYKSAGKLVAGGRGYAGYISSKLSLDGVDSDHTSIVEKIRKKVDCGHIGTDCTTVEHVMRAMLEALADDESWVPFFARVSVNDALMPFMRFYDQQQLIDQHNKYC